MKFSVIIPTFNREHQLSKLLAAIGKLNADSPSFEVIVVDDGSVPALSVRKEVYEYPLAVIRQGNAGPAEARNKGAAKARGDYLIFIDDDCLPYPNWLMGFDEFCTKEHDLLLGGYTINGLENNLYSQATQHLVDFLFEHYHPCDHIGGFFPTNNMLVPRVLFHSLNGFNSSLRYGEDREFCYRWALKKQLFKTAPNAKILHCHELNFVSFLKLHFNYGSGSFHFRRLAARKLYRPVPLSSYTFYLRLIFSPFKKTSMLQATALTVLLFCTQTANAFGMLSLWGNDFFRLTGRRKVKSCNER